MRGSRDTRNIIRSALILTVITLLAGLALAAVYQVTKEPIQQAEAAAALRAYEAVFPGGDFEELPLVPFDGAAYGIADAQGVTVDKIVAVREGETLLGYALTVTSPNGYGGDITVAVGVLTDGTLNGISIISQGETAGLGATCVEDSFTSQFAGITGGTVVFTKTGKKEPNEIDAISGATVTTRAVTAAVNTGLAFVAENFLEEGGSGA
jgi:electron transport complex protein RnfG